MTNHVGTMVDRGMTAHQLDVAGWGLFLIWIGVAVLANLGWGIGLIGVGFLVLATQIARKYVGLRFEGFWAVIGSLFVISGVWETLGVQVSLIPIVGIAAGIALLMSALVGKPA